MRVLFLFLSLITVVSCSQKKEGYRFKVVNDDGVSLARPLSLDLKKIEDSGVNLENPIVLFQEIDGESEEVPFQVDKTKNQLWFVSPSGKANGENSYRIENGVRPRKTESFLSADKENGSLQLSIKNKPMLHYRYEMHYPPEGVDSVFQKSGYIHPVLTPKGDTLSRINPPDHWHHYGIWGPWTHTRIDTMRVDFWNLVERQGTVLFKEFNSAISGPAYSGFNAAQEHIDRKTQKEARVALNENLEVRLWNLGRPDRYMFDYTTSFRSPLKEGILFEAYRYGGGIGMRFTERWKADNCSVLTSEGKDRLSADGSNARWCIVSGASADEKGTAGILFMSHPENRAHPEPMRVWPIDANGGRGDMFFEFCPIRHEEWQIEPNKAYELKYRMVVFDGDLSADEAEAYWQSFAKPPEIEQNIN
ncbi:MAG TPA: PmoA family protein [Pricia sp.]|nr:PmoA family protein [Pricia sp.]